jgi:hypothetical protein
MAVIMENASIPRLATAIVPTRHIYTNRIFVTPVEV